MVPVSETLDFLKRKLPNLNLDLPFSIEMLIDLIEICIKDSVFEFNNEFYRQKHGMAMGSSLSPILSNIFMEYFETELLPTITDKKWLRYVDDCFLSWPDDDSFEVFLDRLNSLHPNIKFKYEWEDQRSLPFLDVNVHRSNDNVLSFSVYRKPSNSLSYIHYFSAHSDSIKKSVISSQFLRGLRICDPPFIDEEIRKIFEIFGNLGYPGNFIRKCLSSAKSNFYGSRRRSKFNQDSNKIISLPYNESLDKIKYDLRNSGCELVFNYPSTVSKSLINNRPNTNEQCGTYEISCNNCPKKYFGETGRSVNTRINEHKRDVRNGNENNAIFLHIQNTQHSINWNNPRLVYKSSDFVRRRVVESTLINNFENMNVSNGSFKLNKVLENIIIKNVNYHH